MKIRKVQELINVLTRNERKEFVRWLEFDLNGRQPNTLQLAQGILKNHSIVQLWPSIYPEKPLPESPYKDSSFRRLEHQLSLKVEEYLAIHRLRKDDNLLEWKLIEELNHRNAHHIFLNRYNRAIREMESQSRLSESYYQHRYHLEREWRYYLLKQGKRKELPQNLQHINHYLDGWWLHTKMRAELVNISQRQPEKGHLVEEVLDLVDTSEEFQELPLLQTYSNLYKLLRDDDIASAAEIQAWLAANHCALQPDVSQDIFNMLHNYYVRNFNRTGTMVYAESLWALYQFGIEIGIFIHNGQLAAARYRNLLETGLRVGATKQVWNYLVDLKDLLPPEQRDEEYRFNLGGYYAKLGDYPMAARTLAQKFSHPHKEVNARMKLLRLRFQSGDREDLEHELRAIKELCRRNYDMNPDFRLNATNEIKVFLRLIKAFSPAQLRGLTRLIDQMTPLVSRKWFGEQVEKIG